MTQNDLNREVAAATGETVSTISGMGFSLADPDDVYFDPDPVDLGDDMEAMIIDWDHYDAERNVPLVPQHAA